MSGYPKAASDPVTQAEQATVLAALSGTYVASLGGAATVPLVMPTPDGDPNVTHPSVVYVAEGWNGYRYWMAYTPYPDASREQPCVAASKDGVTWVRPTGSPAEIATLAEVVALGLGFTFNSDTELVMLADNTLALYWRPAGGQDGVYRKTSANGVTWSAPQQCLLGASGTLLSPTVVILADGSFAMWTINNTVTPAKVQRRTSANGTTWSAASDCALPADFSAYSGAQIPFWHLTVQRVGATFYMLMNAFHTGSPPPYRLYYFTSTDGITWTGKASPVVPLSIGEEGHYRSAFVPVVGTDPLCWDLWVATKNDATVTWRFVYHRRVNLGVGTPKEHSDGPSIWVSAKDLWPQNGVPNEAKLGSYTWAWFMDQTAFEILGAVVRVPSSWKSVQATLFWGNASTGTGNVLWRLGVCFHPGDVPVDSATIVYPVVDALVAAGAQFVVTRTLLSYTQRPVGGPWRFQTLLLQRRAMDATDTLPNDAAVIGVLLEPGP